MSYRIEIRPAAIRALNRIDHQDRDRIGDQEALVNMILRGSQPLVDPDPQARLEVGDDLVVACREDDRAALERFLAEGP